MAGKVFTLWGSIRADDKKLKSDLDSAHRKVSSAAAKMRTSVDTAAKKMGKALGVAMVIGAGIAVYEMQKVGRAAIKAASDLEETTGKFNVVFKGQEAVAKEWADTLVESYAMSTREAKQFLSSIQDLLVPMGMNAEEAGKMSFEVVKLSADLASFNNLPTAQVMLDIQSALVGNFETMKKYGVVLNETVVKQKALAMGLWDGEGAINANIKAQVAYKLMLEGSAAALGDLDRTMGSYANQVKSLGASYEDLLAAIGNKLLPMATAIVSETNLWIQANTELIAQGVGDVTSQWAKGLVWVLEAIQGVVEGIGFIARAWDSLPVAANAAIYSTIKAFELLMSLVESVLHPLEVLFHAFIALGILDFNPITEAIKGVKKVINDLGVSTRSVLDDSVDKLIETTAKYDDYDKAIQEGINSVEDAAKPTEDFGDAVLEMGDEVEKATEKIYKTVIILDEVKTALTGIQSYKSIQIEVDVIDNATPKTKKILADIGAITGKKQTFSTGKVGPAGDMGDPTMTGTVMESAGGGHKAKIDLTGNAAENINALQNKIDEIRKAHTEAKIDVTGDATIKTKEIKSKIDEIKEPVKIPVVVDAKDGIKLLTTVDRYHDNLDGKRTDSYHTVHVAYEGKGSSTKPLGEKVAEVNEWLKSTQDIAKEGATYTVDFTGKGSSESGLFDKIDQLINKMNDFFEAMARGSQSAANSLSTNMLSSIDMVELAIKRLAAGLSSTLLMGKDIGPLADALTSLRAATGLGDVNLNLSGKDALEAVKLMYPKQTVYGTIIKLGAAGTTARTTYYLDEFGNTISTKFGYQSGGYIPGYGGGDTVPVWAEKGEYVSDKDTVKNFGVGFFDGLKRAKGTQASVGKSVTTTEKSVSKPGANHSSIFNFSGPFMGNKAEARQYAIMIKRELDELNSRWA